MRYTYNKPPSPARYKPPKTEKSREDMPTTNEDDMNRFTRETKDNRTKKGNRNPQVPSAKQHPLEAF